MTIDGLSNSEIHGPWIGEKGPGGFDLRSDTMTTPTASMLKAIQSCTLGDDVCQEDETTRELEAHVAALTGKEAGLFVLSGIMGNQVALRTHLNQFPQSVLCDSRSHIVQYEAGGVSSMTGALVRTVMPKNGIHLTLEDVQANVVLEDDIHSCPTRVISLENTLNGMIMPLSEARRISIFARSHGIKLHCDGARLWEAAASGAGTLPEFCELFDTITLCFSKGLGAPVGSLIVGTARDMKHCRWIRRSIGGGTRQPGLLTAAARIAVDETFGTKVDGSSGWLKSTHALAKEVEAMWTAKGGSLVHPTHTNMIWLDLDTAGINHKRLVEVGEEFGLKLLPGRIVVHYQIVQNAEEVLKRLNEIFERVITEGFRQPSSKQRNVGVKSMYRA
ncbi:hypothetical protein NM208_g1764 [Fusarium decemcellulare]|uniref:Uncharacterized protein n=1 Tax=Fusarium decemcellulare TaxID=57161 RepID=A0ACC1SVI5_9HYPO|nr:hypothetical protein NM208_g1764 [Fusarium decemcellulare]